MSWYTIEDGRGVPYLCTQDEYAAQMVLMAVNLRAEVDYALAVYDFCQCGRPEH